MTTLIEADVEQAARDWLEGLGEPNTARSKENSSDPKLKPRWNLHLWDDEDPRPAGRGLATNGEDRLAPVPAPTAWSAPGDGRPR